MDGEYSNRSLEIGLVFLIVTAILIVIIVAYHVYWRPSVTTTSCQNNNNCGVGQMCQLGACVEITCTSDSDCNGNGICINSFCTPLTCQSGNDCPTGTACMSGDCVQVGQSCQINSDCFELSCMDNICVQCITNSNCTGGQGCFDNICRFPYAGETGVNVLNFPSVAQENGNISAPPGYFCPSNNCGMTGTISCGNSGSSGTCPSSCQFCIDSVCRCTPGQNLEPCNTNSDCISGICGSTELGRVCIPSGGECISNYNGTGGIRVCPVSRPYCVNGICSLASLGAICGASGMPDDLCSNPQSLGVVGPTGVSPNGMGFFCVNGTCQQNPGQLNSLCTPGSCEFIQEGVLICAQTSSSTIPQSRCIVGDTV